MANEPLQGDPKPGGEGGAGDGDPKGGANPQPNNPAPAPSGDQFDPTTLTPEQLNQVLEKNPNIWKTDRLAGLRDKAKKFDDAETARAKAEQEKLTEQGKFKELSEQQTQTIENLQKQVQDSNINQALTNKLAPLGVVDLEGALKLIDRSGIKVDESGTVTGLDEAIEALKTGKAYLFNKEGQQSVGSPTNPDNGSGTGGPAKFKRSQLKDQAFYQEHRDEILKAQAAGLIEDDLK